MGFKITIGHQTKREWKAYPNPTTGDNLSLVMTGQGQDPIGQVAVRMFSGDFLTSTKLVNYGLELDMEISLAIKKAPKGIVILELVHEGKESHVKILKHK